jgi:hypothetical protein
MVSVVTDPILAGQSVTVAAHDVMVYTVVVLTVEVVYEMLDEVVAAAPLPVPVDEGVDETEEELTELELDDEDG